jgi:transposase
MNTLIPHPDRLTLIKLTTTADAITAHMQTSERTSSCPLCHQPSSRVHSHYFRSLVDLPLHGVTMRLALLTRRFFCATVDCPRRIFTERLPGIVTPYARRTVQVDIWLHLVGLALGGEAGARLLSSLGIQRSPDTVLASIRSLMAPPYAPPRVVGVDEFAFRRGRVFGTILVDWETHHILDLLPDCTVATVQQWLQHHPSIEMVSRDRATNFGEAIRQGAPQAIQVADRWHVLENLGKRGEMFWREHKDRLQTPRQVQLDAHPPLRNRTDRMERRSIDYHQNRVDLYGRVHELHQRGLNAHAIATLLEMTRHTASKYVHMTAPPTRRRGPDGQPLAIEAFAPYLLQRWNEGCRNANQLWREVVARGFSQSAKTVSRYVAVLRHETGQPRSFRAVPPDPQYDVNQPPRAALTPRQAAKLFQRRPRLLTASEQAQIAHLCQQEDVATFYQHVQTFCQLVRSRQGDQWEAWLIRIEAEGTTELQAFARGIRKDQAAMTAGFTLKYSQGPVEGHVHRVKLIKRSSYGKMGFSLLRQRVLLRQ